jgi:hypothetical protein
MSIRSAGAALVVAVALLSALQAVALGATPAQNRQFATSLAAKIKPVFKKQAPKLALSKVTCVLPLNGTVVHCKAHFSYPSAGLNVVYGIKATLQETGDIKWVTTTHSCTNAKTGKTVAC